MSVYRQTGDNLIGFYHAEDRWVCQKFTRVGALELTFSSPDSWSMASDVVWKSIGVAYSSDNGYTWRDGGQVLRHPQNKPANPQWGGVGDMDVIWDFVNSRWVCYFSDGRISMAVSYDFSAAPGTWRKWYQGCEFWGM